MSRDRRIWALVSVGAAALLVHLGLGLSMGEDYAIPSTILGIVGATVALRGPLGQAVANWLQGGGSNEALPSDQVLGELDELRSRLVELEERVDFSERLLVKHREGAEQPGA